MSAETFKDSTDYVNRSAPERFKNHVLIERRQWVWKVARADGRWQYGFYLLVAPGAVVVYGDIGEAVFRIYAVDEQAALDWVLRCSKDLHYTISKLANLEAYRRFYPGDALAYAEKCENESKDQETGHANACDFCDDVRREIDGGDLSGQTFWTLAHDHGFHDVPACVDWAPSAFWFAHALQTFARLKQAEIDARRKANDEALAAWTGEGGGPSA